jgi:hypothetical protein
VAVCPLRTVCLLTHLPNIKSTPEAQLRPNSLPLMTSCPLFFGPTTFSKPKDMATKIRSSTKTTKVLSYSKRMAASRAARELDISIVDFTLSLTASTRTNCLFNTVSLRKWSVTSLLNLCKANSSTNSDVSL